MKEEKTKKRKILYYLILAISICLLTAATVLTVYFVTENNRETLQKDPDPIITPKPDDPTDNPDTPTGGDAEKFCAPIEYSDASVFNDIYASKTTGFIYRHRAVDFMAAEGTKVASIGDGTVEEISLSKETGNLITVNYGGGLKGYYRFVEPDSTLKEGATLKKGQYFATVAAAYGSEAKDGTHLHFELSLNGKHADPASYLDIDYEEK